MPLCIATMLRLTVACLVAPASLLWMTLGPASAQTPAVDPAASPFSSCREAARDRLRAGLSALALLDPAAARTAFERAGRIDPDCAMAPWGQALAWLRLPDADATPAEWRRAEDLLSQARSAGRVSAHEREWLDAARALAEPLPPLARLRGFASASRAVAARAPGSPHAAMVAAMAALAISSVPGDEWQRRAAGLVWPLATAAATDPALATLSALACLGRSAAAPGGAPDETSACLSAARVVVAARPSAPRALLAAARVFHRAGEWDAAVGAGEAALAVAGGDPQRTWLAPGRWREHPLPWLVQADVERGRFTAARDRLRAASDRYATLGARLNAVEAWRWRCALDLASMRLQWALVDWQADREWPHPMDAGLQAAGVPPPAGAALADADLHLDREVRAWQALLRGLLAARAAWPRGEPDRLAVARESARVLEHLSLEVAAPPRMEWMRTIVLGAVAAALEAREELALLRLQLDGLHRELVDGGAIDGLPVSGDALVGEWHLQLRDLPEAAQRFGVAANDGPGHARSWLGRARAERAAGRLEAAALAYQRLLDGWTGPGEPLRELDEARAYLAQDRNPGNNAPD